MVNIGYSQLQALIGSVLLRDWSICREFSWAAMARVVTL